MFGTSFLPQTLGAWAAIVAAVGAGVGSVLAFINRKTVQEIKVNVNHRLDNALEEIARLNEAIGVAKTQPAEEPDDNTRKQPSRASRHHRRTDRPDGA